MIGKEETEQFGEKIASQYRVMLPPVAEADGERARLCWSYDNLAMQANKVSLNAACAKKEAVIAFLDSLYLTENSLYSMFGDENFVAKGENADFVALLPGGRETGGGRSRGHLGGHIRLKVFYAALDHIYCVRNFRFIYGT